MNLNVIQKPQGPSEKLRIMGDRLNKICRMYRMNLANPAIFIVLSNCYQRTKKVLSRSYISSNESAQKSTAWK